jgi:hypothetical protein
MVSYPENWDYPGIPELSLSGKTYSSDFGTARSTSSFLERLGF